MSIELNPVLKINGGGYFWRSDEIRLIDITWTPEYIFNHRMQVLKRFYLRLVVHDYTSKEKQTGYVGKKLSHDPEDQPQPSRLYS